MKIYNCEQGTQEWHKIRLCKITASKYGDLMGKTFGKTVHTYANELIAELETGKWKEVNAKQMEWGHEHEPDARAFYQATTFNYVNQVGFVEHDEYVGCSPDGFVEENGLVEIKCPWNSSNHVVSVRKKEVPLIYKAQVQGQLWCCEREWCDFVSYDPRMKNDKKKIVIIRVDRDEEYIKLLEERIYKFREMLKGFINEF